MFVVEKMGNLCKGEKGEVMYIVISFYFFCGLMFFSSEFIICVCLYKYVFNLFNVLFGSWGFVLVGVFVAVGVG